MEIPIQLIAAAFTALLLMQGWQLRELFQLKSDLRVIEATLIHKGYPLPTR